MQILIYKVLLGFPGSSAGKEFACNTGDSGSIPGLGRSPGEGIGYPFQYSGLKDYTDCKVHGVAKRRTRLSNFQSNSILIKTEHESILKLSHLFLQVCLKYWHILPVCIYVFF